MYVISIQNSKFEHEPGEHFMKIDKVKGCTNSNGYMWVVLNNNNVFYPNESLSSHVYVNSYDVTSFSRVNSTVYATTKRACLEKAKEIIEASSHTQRKTLERLKEQLAANDNMMSQIDDSLINADLPDTMEEFAEMPL